ncbi:MAG: (5-formylfuran-3-yl)methyl phosphate synthase [Planctomycetaceae bacterium]
MSSSPQFLVSVRNANECEAAVFGGADIIDVKEPANGPLGMADGRTLQAIRDRLTTLDTAAPFSIALGEISDWFEGPALRRGADLLAEEICHLNSEYLKLGLTGRAAWREDWAKVRELPFGRVTWVAVAYADFSRCDAPSPEEVLAEGRKTGCGVLLIDTFRKDGSSLLDWMERDRMKRIQIETSAAGMKLALAGKVTTESLPDILEICPDIVAVRGAVCEQGRRERSVDQCLVAGFRRELQAIR